jgi:hypothetical protein
VFDELFDALKVRRDASDGAAQLADDDVLMSGSELPEHGVGLSAILAGRIDVSWRPRTVPVEGDAALSTPMSA